MHFSYYIIDTFHIHILVIASLVQENFLIIFHHMLIV